MSTWTAQELERIGKSEELQLASARSQGGISRFVTMWVVRAGDELYVRSAHGPDNPWYRRARAATAGQIRAGGLERAVTFDTAEPAVQGAIDAVNTTLPSYETIKKFTILPRDFSQETGELTPTLKVKRKVVLEHFADEIETMYRDDP